MHLPRIRLATVASVAAALVVGGLVVTPAAKAAITASSITTPTDPAFLVSPIDPATGDATGTFAIAGTTTGGDPGTDQVDILCYYGASSHVTVASGVALNPDGSFAVPAASMTPTWQPPAICRLHAVPAATTPAYPTPVAGARVAWTGNRSFTVNGGPNDGHLYDYYLYAQQLTGAFDYDSISGCGLDDAYLFDPTFALTTTTFYCNAALFETVQ